MVRMRALRVRRKPHTVFGTIKAQALSKQVELVLVFYGKRNPPAMLVEGRALAAIKEYSQI